MKKHTVSHLSIKALKFSKFFADVSIAQETNNYNSFSGFCSPEFDNFMTQLAIF